MNNALGQTSAGFTAIFDADHAPGPTFLDETRGFLADERLPDSREPGMGNRAGRV